jgi:hypothetical protein
MLEMLVLFFVVAIGGFVAAAMAMAAVGFALSLAFGLATFVLFKIAPLVLLGWLAYRLIRRGASRRVIAAADERWLDGPAR